MVNSIPSLCLIAPRMTRNQWDEYAKRIDPPGKRDYNGAEGVKNGVFTNFIWRTRESETPGKKSIS